MARQLARVRGQRDFRRFEQLWLDGIDKRRGFRQQPHLPHPSDVSTETILHVGLMQQQPEGERVVHSYNSWHSYNVK